MTHEQREKRRLLEWYHRGQAEHGFGFSIPVLVPAKDDKPAEVVRAPITLEHMGQSPKVWVAWLNDAMQRAQKGFPKESQRRTEFADYEGSRTQWQAQRREDKIKAAERAARQPVYRGRLNYPRSKRRAMVAAGL